jgi:hypothetical protein
VPWVNFGPGGSGFICGRRMLPPKPCHYCGEAAEQLCDFPLTGKKTCSRRLCLTHAFSPGEGTDFCPEHRTRNLI